MVFILIGSSASGKTTIAKKLVKNLTNKQIKIELKCTNTSRPIREKDGEKDGIDYNFKTKEEMLKAKEEGKLLEIAEVSGEYYGTNIDILGKTPEETNKIKTNKKHIEIILTASGASEVQKECKKRKIPVFTIALGINKKAKLERMKKRGDKEKNISKRMKEKIYEEAIDLYNKKELKIDIKIEDTSKYTEEELYKLIFNKILKEILKKDKNLQLKN